MPFQSPEKTLLGEGWAARQRAGFCSFLLFWKSGGAAALSACLAPNKKTDSIHPKSKKIF